MVNVGSIVGETGEYRGSVTVTGTGICKICENVVVYFQKTDIRCLMLTKRLYT